MNNLSGRTALITGAGRGIGRQIAHRLVVEGMAVGVNDIDPVSAGNVVAELREKGGRAVAIPAGVDHGEAVSAMVERVEAELGPLWLLVNNAGIFNAAPTAEMSEEMWDQVFAVDAKGVFLCSQAAIQRMIHRGEGRIVNIASIAGMIVRTKQIAYCAAKAAVIHFSRCLAVELAPNGITVNCLCPGMTWTDMLSASTAQRGLNLEAMVEMIPAGRMAEEKDHANLVAFLASPASQHITGQVIAVDGGQSINHPLQMNR